MGEDAHFDASAKGEARRCSDATIWDERGVFRDERKQ
jgi:hypothetical protein